MKTGPTIDVSKVRGWPRWPTANLCDLGLKDLPATVTVEDGPNRWTYRLTTTTPATGGFPASADYHCGTGNCGSLRLIDV